MPRGNWVGAAVKAQHHRLWLFEASSVKQRKGGLKCSWEEAFGELVSFWEFLGLWAP